MKTEVEMRSAVFSQAFLAAMLEQDELGELTMADALAVWSAAAV